MTNRCAQCKASIPLGRVTCGRAACVEKQSKMMNARNHKERWDARIAQGLCGRCGARVSTAFVTCASCRAGVRARRAAKRVEALRAKEQQQRLLDLAARKAHTADVATRRREAGLPISHSKTPQMPRGATPPADV